MLLEDRFGWQVYRPTGMDWVDAGLWKYSDQPSIQHQFLDPWPQQSSLAWLDCYQAPEVHHPERIHKLVTYEQFRAQKWDYLLASVTQHEVLWHELADSIGARSILQVGNVGQPVDWGLSHLVLAAANIEIPEGRGLIYHPEFSSHDYRYEPPSNKSRHIITSFMNCLPDAGPAYADWRRLQELLPEFTFREYGILGRDGIIGPSSEVGRLMRESGWAFHNKPQGDGYGFLVHQWASVGRPLIGRRSYYEGKLAEPLWYGSFDLDEGMDSIAQSIRLISDNQNW